MIRSEAEYNKAQGDLELALAMLEHERVHWLDEGMTEDEASAMLEPMRLRIAELGDRIDLFERVRAGDLSMFVTLEHVGKALIAARLARGLSQREFADLISVHESQVSRDERNEYHGMRRERLSDLMAALGLQLQGRFRLEGAVVHPRPLPIEQPHGR